MDFKEKLAELKMRAANLDRTIVDQEAKHHLLGLAKNWLGDIERKVPGAALLLPWIEKLLKNAEDAVAKYGPNLRIIG